MSNETNSFRVLFFNEFTKELIKNSRKAEQISSQRILKDRIKKNIKERLKERRENL